MFHDDFICYIWIRNNWWRNKKHLKLVTHDLQGLLPYLYFPRFTTMNFVHLKSKILCEGEERRRSDDRRYMDLSTLTRYTKVIKFAEKKGVRHFFPPRSRQHRPLQQLVLNSICIRRWRREQESDKTDYKVNSQMKPRLLSTSGHGDIQNNEFLFLTTPNQLSYRYEP